MIDVNGYSQALFSIAEELDKTQNILDSTELINKALSEHPEYVKLLDTPALSKDEKLSLIDNAFSGLDEYAINTLKLLCEKHSVYLFSKIVTEFNKLYDKKEGIERVEVITAISINSEQETAIKQKLEAILNKTVIIKNTVDSTILGGVVLRYSGVQLDGSVKTRLDEFKKNLSSIVI